ncbi:MAG: bifunctional diguanylate cyclase/phosphodiesterase [Shinella sp.]|nr:MAG: bifunctional diguanylate cyclase/phosphodiesterase [Shinella sp.]
MTGKIRKKSWVSLRAPPQYYFPALIVVIAVAISIVYADNQRRRLNQENLRTSVAEQLGVIRAKLEGDINANIQLMQGLAAVMETEPQIDQNRFSALAHRIFATPHQLRNVVAAPDFVAKLVYPITGNEKVLGLDYRSNDAQRKAAFEARDTGRYVVTGPIDLVQGGRGLIVRYPISYGNGQGGYTFWGLLSAVIDIGKLYAAAGLEKPGLDINVAIAASSEDSSATDRPFFGDPAVFDDEPVTMTIGFGTESWQIAAVPKGGWDQSSAELWFFRAVMMFVGLMIISPVLWVARLLRERQANIAALRQREEELRALSHRLEIALEASRIGVWELDVSSGELHWDNRMKQLYGSDPGRTSTYQTWCNSLHPDDREATERAFATALETGKDFVTEFRILTPAGEERHIRSYGTTYRDSRFRKKIVGVNWNVTADVRLQHALRAAKLQAELQNQQLEQARKRMEYASLHDALTNLPNRRYLDQYLSEIDSSDGQSNPIVLHIDLDRFKDINDTLGHGAGDAILRHVASKLHENVRSDDFVARIGGDEFVVVCPDNMGEKGFTDLARRLIDAINTPITYDGHECRVGASIGVATRQDPGIPAEQLLINADIALYEAKRLGRNRVERYTDTLKSLTISTKMTADAILKSLEQNGFIAHFQPQFDAHTLEITGVEALARWEHPQQGILGPAAFLKIAENLNVVSQIDAAILDQALLQLTRWRAADLNIRKVSVNISAQRLFDETLMQRLDTLDLAPGSLSFELLESISFDDKGASVTENIERIKQHGIDIEIDDFGTGYASILSLLKLSPRRLKIDRQLTAPIISSAAQRRLISSIVDIGRSLGIEIVAEGVETMQHATILRDLGCQTLQGYALARPMDATSFLDFARNRHWLAEKAAEAV